MCTERLDAAEAARNLLVESDALTRDTRRLRQAADQHRAAAAAFAQGLLAGRVPDGAELLTSFGRVLEAVTSAARAASALDRDLRELRFVFEDEPEPVARIRAHALDELRAWLRRDEAGPR